MRRLLIAVLTLMLAAVPAAADIRILSSSGGAVGDYLSLFEKMRRSGERVVIDGPCLSACTLVLVTIPRSRICVTNRAVLGFHAPRVVEAGGRSYSSRYATRMVTAAYPPAIQRWLRQHGGLTSKVLLLRGRELAGLYRHC